MYDNRVHLMGFLGKDAALRQTSTGREFVVLSLATTASWRDERGEYTDQTKRTDWHRCIAYTLAEIHLSKLRTVDPAAKDDEESPPPQLGNSSEDEAFVS